jgi:hypothetical protein
VSLWGGVVVVGVGLGYPMLLYYVCHEEMLFAPRWSRRGGCCGLGTCISKITDGSGRVWS